MNKQIVLIKAATYSDERVNGSKISIDNYVTTDSMVQGKNGIMHATVLPKGNLIGFKEGDILIGNIRPYLKKIWYSDKNGGCSPDVLVIKSKTGIDSKFLFYSLLRDDFFIHMMNGSKGTKMPRGDKLQILRFQIPDIDIFEQKKIATVLSSIEFKIQLNNRINAELESMSKTLYDYWFVQFDFPNEYGKPYKSSGGKMIWNEELNREIPKGWTVEPLFDAMDVQYGFPFSTSKFTDLVTDKPVIRIRDILQKSISLYTSENVDSKYQLKRNDLLIGMDGNFHLNFWDKDGAYLNQRSVRIRERSNKEISSMQAFFELKPYIKARETNVSRTTVGHLSDKDLKRLYLISPNSKSNFNPKMVFNSMLNDITSNRLQNQKLAELRDWLLPMLMNGQVKVN